MRGAVAPVENTREEIFAATRRLLEQLLAENSLTAGDLVFVLFSATKDLNAAYPAAAARTLPDFDSVPMLCLQEMAVEGSMARCLRVLAAISAPKQDVRHVYLDDAAGLRPDWSEGNEPV